MNIAFATMEKIENRPLNSVGSSRIRARWVAKYWNEVFSEDQAGEYLIGRRYDVMIFQKAYWREMMLQFKGIKIFDLCDPDWLEPRPVVESAQLCDAVTTSTEALAEYLRHFIKDKPIVCIPDRVDLEEHSPRGVHQGDLKRLIWFGYSHNMHYLEKTFPFLIEKNLQLTLVSNAPYSPPLSFQKLQFRNVLYNFGQLHEEIKKADAVLLPETTDDLKGKFKSNNKTLTAWALGMPVISVPEDFDRFWTEESRNKERDRVLKETKDKWDVRISVKEYKDLIESIQKADTK